MEDKAQDSTPKRLCDMTADEFNEWLFGGISLSEFEEEPDEPYNHLDDYLLI